VVTLPNYHHAILTDNDTRYEIHAPRNLTHKQFGQYEVFDVSLGSDASIVLIYRSPEKQFIKLFFDKPGYHHAYVSTHDMVKNVLYANVFAYGEAGDIEEIQEMPLWDLSDENNMVSIEIFAGKPEEINEWLTHY
jgi:hypothetical protein